MGRVFESHHQCVQESDRQCRDEIERGIHRRLKLTQENCESELFRHDSRPMMPSPRSDEKSRIGSGTRRLVPLYEIGRGLNLLRKAITRSSNSGSHSFPPCFLLADYPAVVGLEDSAHPTRQPTLRDDLWRLRVSNYRRYYVPGGMYFFTLVTHERRPLFADAVSRRLLREAILKEQQKRPFGLYAIVLLPDHCHTIWSLPPGDKVYSLRWTRIKETFTRNYLAAGGTEGTMSPSRESQQERAVWQRRFWEHTIVDEDDLKRCVDYIHWNPVKHGLVLRVCDWEWSSFHRFVEMGEYEQDWGKANPCAGYNEPEWE